jgi:hypothetical protein
MSVQPSPNGDNSVLATFRLPRQVQASSVHVVGDFNDWSPSSHPMDIDDEGYVVQIPLQAGRRHRFRYLIDGQRWENDWSADDYVDNDFGGTDSVLDLTRMPSAVGPEAFPPVRRESASEQHPMSTTQPGPAATDGA